MISTPVSLEIPLRTDADGAIRIGDTRVLLEIVIHAYQQGKTPQEIVDSFPSLEIEDVYAVIAYYLHNRDEVDAYVRWVDEEGERIRQELEAHQPDTAQLGEKLLARLAEKKLQQP